MIMPGTSLAVNPVVGTETEAHTQAYEGTGIMAALLAEGMNEGARADVIVKLSRIHGLGLFAKRTFATGETVVAWTGRPVTAEHPLDRSRGETEAHCIREEGGRLVYLGYPARFINHACDPNAFLRCKDGMTYVVALKPIRPNEEILLHYGVNRSQSEAMPCNCASSRCLGAVPGDFFELPVDVQVELSPLLQPWYVEEHGPAYRKLLQDAGILEGD